MFTEDVSYVSLNLLHI